MRMLVRIIALLAVPTFVLGCAGGGRASGGSASADLRDASGKTVGTARLTEAEPGGGPRLELEVRGLPPGEHGVHIHETGTCEPPDFESAGGHYNPESRQHGDENPAGPHAGDLPNMTVSADGSGTLEETVERVTLSDGPHSLFDDDGSTLVVHAGPDDYRTDPAGNSGDRVACGVIRGG